LYNKLKNIPLALKNLAFIEKKFLYPLDKFRVFRLRHEIMKGNKKRNKEAYKSKLEIEVVIPMEE
jgi:hypothetical protein